MKNFGRFNPARFFTAICAATALMLAIPALSYLN